MPGIMHIELVERRDGWHIEFISDHGAVYEQREVYPTREAAKEMVDRIVSELSQIPGAVATYTKQ